MTAVFEDLIASAKMVRPEWASRIDRAADIVRGHFADPDAQRMYLTIQGADWATKVRASSGDAYYTVVLHRNGEMSCDCGDFVYRQMRCKHCLSAWLLGRIRGGKLTRPVLDGCTQVRKAA